MTTPLCSPLAPLQSTSAEHESIAQSPSADILPGVIGAKRRDAIDYEQNVKHHRSTAPEDMDGVISAASSTNKEETAMDTRALFIEDVRTLMAELLVPIKAATSALETKFSNLETKFSNLEAKFSSAETKIFDLNKRITQLSYNSSSCFSTDLLIPPLMFGKNEPPTDAPTSVEQIDRLQDGPLLASLEAYYELPTEGTLSKRKQALRRAYGASAIFWV